MERNGTNSGEGSDRFLAELHRRLCATDLAKASQNPVATLLRIVIATAMRHPLDAFRFWRWMERTTTQAHSGALLRRGRASCTSKAELHRQQVALEGVKRERGKLENRANVG